MFLHCSVFRVRGGGLAGRLLTAQCLLSVFCKATGASTHPLAPLGVKAGNRGSNAQLACWELGWVHAAHSVLQRVFAEYGTWLDLCMCVGNKRNSRGPPGVLGPGQEADKQTPNSSPGENGPVRAVSTAKRSRSHLEAMGSEQSSTDAGWGWVCGGK